MRATVVTIRTVLQPSNENSTHTIVIANSLARSTDEGLTWRLYHLNDNRVTFVDEATKTFRTETMAELVEKKRSAYARTDGRDSPEVNIAFTGARRLIVGVSALQTIVRVGGYVRELWIGTHPDIPPRLFALMQASETLTASHPALSRQIDSYLLSVRGFPLADHSELSYGDSKIVARRDVVSVAERNVPRSLLQIPRDYRDVTRPAERPRSAS